MCEGGRGQDCDGRIKMTRGERRRVCEMELQKNMKESSVMEEKARDGKRQRGGEFRSFGVINIVN